MAEEKERGERAGYEADGDRMKLSAKGASDGGLKERTAKGLLWGGIGNGAMQVLNLLFGVFLSRLLSPADYGVVGALTIFSATAGIFSESGFTLAIVNKKRVGDEDYNTVFWFNIIIGAFFYILLFICAPFIADFYHKPEIAPVARFLFLGFLLGATSTAPAAYYFRNMMVKTRSKIQIAAIMAAGTVGLICACNGMGYWGLAVQTVTYSLLTSLLLWVFCPWRPAVSFSMTSLRELLPFSSRQLLTSLFTHVNNNVFSVLLGRFYGMTQTGYYTQGSKWTTMGYSTIFGMINSVGQPVFRESSAERERLCRVFVKMLRFTAFVSFPAMLGLALVSHELIVIAVTDKWLACVPVMHILCVWGAFMPIATLYTNLFNSLGRPGLYMWNTIALGLLQLLCLVASYPFGLMTMLTVYTAINIGWLFVYHYFCSRLTGLRLLRAIGAITPYLLCAVGATAVAWYAARCVSGLTDGAAGTVAALVSLAVKVLVAGGLYLAVLWAAGSVVLRETLGFLRRKGK